MRYKIKKIRKIFLRILAVLLVLSFCLPVANIYLPTLKPINAYAGIGDYDYIVKNNLYTSSFWSNKPIYALGQWDVVVDGRSVGKTWCFEDREKWKMTQYNTISSKMISNWATAFNGDPDYVEKKSTVSSVNPGNYKRIMIRDIVNYSGATLTYVQGKITVYPSEYPTASISKPWGKLTPNETYTIGISGAYSYGSSGTYKFKIDGKTVSSGSFYSSGLNKKIDYTFDESGTYTATLTVTDSIERETVVSKTITVAEEAVVTPPSYGDNIPPVARFDIKDYAEINENVNVTESSYDSDGVITNTEWEISPDDDVDNRLTDDGGKISFENEGTYAVKLTVSDNKGATDSVTKTITIGAPPAPDPIPPTAKIKMSDVVVQGQEVSIRSGSYDEDGTIEDCTWTITPKTDIIGELKGEESTLYFDKEGDYKIKLKVTDDSGLSDEVEKTITVKPAIPLASFEIYGALKQNRAVILDATTSTSTEKYPVIIENTEWEIIPMTAGIDPNTIKIRGTSPLDKREVLFKSPGIYKIRLKVANEKHASEWIEETVEILPDLNPVADFFVNSVFLRDPLNQNKVMVNLMDKSYSEDSDAIEQRLWKYRFDSDDDGSFEDESWVTIDSSNNLSPILMLNKVGRYIVELEVKEGFGQPTLNEFITDTDRLKANTALKENSKKTFIIDNVQPQVSFTVNAKKKADIVFTVGNADQSKVADLNAKINSYIKTKLSANNINYQISSVETQSITTQTNFPWDKYDHNSAVVNGSTITFNGYKKYGYSDLWYNNEQTKGKQTFTFVLDERAVNYHSFYGGGFIFGGKEESNGVFNGYVLLYNSSNTEIKAVRNTSLSNWSDEDRDFPYETLKAIGKKTSAVRNIKMEINGAEIKVWENNELIISYTLPELYGNGFGLIADHNRHNCNRKSTFVFKDLEMKTESGKSLDEVIKEPEWRDESSRFLINISDVMDCQHFFIQFLFGHFS